MLDRFDQAQGLRRLFARPAVRVLPVAADEDERLAPFCGALAAALARLGRRPVVLDADRGRVAPVLGLRARFDLLHVLGGDCAIGAALCADPRGFSVLPSARGLDALGGRDDAAQLFAAFGGLRPAFDVAVLVAPPARLVRTLGAAIEPLVVAATDPAGVQAAWRRIVAMRQDCGVARMRTVWRAAAGGHPAAHAQDWLCDTLTRYAGVELFDGGAYASADDRPALERIAARALEATLPEFAVEPPGARRAPARPRMAEAVAAFR